MLYEFYCPDHPGAKPQVVFAPSSQYESIVVQECPICGSKFSPDLRGHGGAWFKQTFGKWTGTWDYDYGRKATWDLTPPGKMDELKRMGKIKDPFDSAPPPVTNEASVGDI
jgi:hypothetical protein